jgi:transcriptional regulator with XRE-family HTH domain
MNIDIGNRLREHRQQKGLSQRALARLAGVTNGLISQIEQNSISPSIASLKKILDVLSLSLADFFASDAEAAPPDHFYERKRLPNLGSGDVAIFLVGAGLRHRAMSILHEVYPPGADTQMYTHAGEEGGVVTRGRIEITVGGKTRVLGPGDGYYFESRLPHRFRNTGSTPCEIISANSPPTF